MPSSDDSTDITPREGVASHHSLVSHHGGHSSGHQRKKKSEFKRKVNKVLSSGYVEVSIVVLILLDIAIIMTEFGIDNGYVCIGGRLLKVSPTTLGERYPPMQANQGRHGNPEAGNQNEHGASHPALAQARSLIQITGHHKPETNDDVSYTRQMQSTPFPPPLPNGVINLPYYYHDKISSIISGVFGHQSVEGQHDEAVVSNSLVCDGDRSHNIDHLEHVFHRASVLIISIYAAEVTMKMWVQDFNFRHSWDHSLDFVVVMLSLFVEIGLPWCIGVFRFISRSSSVGADITAGLLLMLRFWRILQVTHSIYEIAHKPYAKIMKLKAELAKSREKMVELEVLAEGQAAKIAELAATPADGTTPRTPRTPGSSRSPRGSKAAANANANAANNAADAG